MQLSADCHELFVATTLRQSPCLPKSFRQTAEALSQLRQPMHRALGLQVPGQVCHPSMPFVEAVIDTAHQACIQAVETLLLLLKAGCRRRSSEPPPQAFQVSAFHLEAPLH